MIDGPIKDAPPVRSAAFRQTMGHAIGTPCTSGNRITTLNNGDGTPR